MSFEEIQDNHRDAKHRNFSMATVRSIGATSEWNDFSSSESPAPHCLPPSFSLIRLTIRKQVSFQDLNSAILNLHVIPMPPNKFGLNPT